ncbi:MAG: Holliday junction branch migration protein RuvA [Thermotogae bacterium]|nr:Holliday junction branch migration protein RuvA [Thermotogota bacterium]
MIAGLRGRVVKVKDDGVILEISSGVSFYLKVPTDSIPPEGEEVRFHVHTIFNQQTGFELYGFTDERQMEVFRTLLEVPGIGPSMALRILSELSLEELATAVRTGNVSALKRVRGLGTKKAEMVIFALKDVPLPEGGSGAYASEAIKALTNLGIDYVQARTLVSEALSQGYRNVEDLIRYALQKRSS